MDSIIKDLFYQPDRKQNTSSAYLHGLIESKLGISTLTPDAGERECSWTRDLGSGPNSSKLKIRDAPDKTLDTIENKISRKSDKQTPENVPWSIKLIKDHKRNSIIFDEEKEIFEYLKCLKVLFGENLDKE